ncbi:M56 family metallopeptidase [Sediminibacter sp. Hel_I_10]|uniref:M56 family metallopeptidase n=1 Tax=Sediminibacter sp. Hel_I_10 TaxID=1392490 RepID=UPI00068CD70F|nr:M56 family metallopeptidase [Sediminibacter sp. Hel_I_10]
MVHYYLQVVAFQLFFLIIYDLFLKKETFFNWNRAYLLVTALLSVVLPFIKIDRLSTLSSEEFIVRLPEVVIGKTTTSIDPAIADYAGITLSEPTTPTWQILLWIGMGVAALVFLIKISKLALIYIKNQQHWRGPLLIIKLMNSSAAFSFFHYVFLGEKIQDQEKDAILEHELVHVKQKHTFDLLFFELMRIAFWFNPLVYMYQSRMTILHEYIADHKAVKFQNKTQYYNQLLSQVFETRQFSFVNPFFKQSLIKKRIVMLNQAKSKQKNIFKYALLVPLVLGMLFYVSCHKESLAEDDPATFDLSQYSYSMEKGTTEMTKETKVIHEAYENFLISHPNYVSWAVIDKEFNRVFYSVHPVDEAVPEGFSRMEFHSKEKGSYVIFMNLGSSNDTIVQMDEIDVKDYDGAIEVPFSVIDEVPTLLECTEQFVSRTALKQCTSDFITSHVSNNLNTDLASQLGLTGRQRINVIFKIDTQGHVVDVRSRAPDAGPEKKSILEEEAIRVINTLPQFIPGKQKGKAVVVPYSLPILFQVNENANTANSSSQPQDLDEIPFSVVDQAPRFQGCESFTNNNDVQKCTTEMVSNYVSKNFNRQIAKQNGLTGRQRIQVIFKIDKQGNITGARARAPHPALEKEALRVVNSLPNFQAGEHNGQPVTVLYSLPILFNVD